MKWCKKSLYLELVASVIKRDGVACHWCGKPTPENAHWNNRRRRSLDHLIERSAGGSNDVSNLVLAHQSCNEKRPSVGAGKITHRDLLSLFAHGETAALLDEAAA